MTPETIRKLKVLGGLLGVGGIILVIFLSLKHHFLPPGPTSHDSPVEVAGGSIHICATSDLRPGSGGDYVAVTDDYTQIQISGVQGINIPPLGNGWTISLSNTDGSNKKADAVTLTSNRDNNILIHIRGDSNWIRSGNRELHFHDRTSCPGASEDPRCDHLVDVTIAAPPGSPPSLPATPCQTGTHSGVCKIGIGHPTASPSCN